MNLYDDDEPVNEEIRHEMQQSGDAYYAAVEHTLRYFMGRSEEDDEIEV